MTTPGDFVERVCKLGQGHACCRYLVVDPHQGLQCIKLDAQFKRALDERVAMGLMVARGDNCEGMPLNETLSGKP